MNKHYTNQEVATIASKLGYIKTNKCSKNRTIYAHPKGKNYITHDIDSHNGGFWKLAKTIKDLASKNTRIGTYDKDLNIIGP